MDWYDHIEWTEEKRRFVEECKKKDPEFARANADPVLVKVMKGAIDGLDEKEGWYRFIPSGAKKGYLRDIKVDRFGQFCQYGELRKLKVGLGDFLRMYAKMTDEQREETIRVIERLTASLIVATGEESAYIIVRTHPPGETKENYQPRWHEDGHYLRRGAEHKIVVALNGRGTMVSAPTPQQRREYSRLEEPARALEYEDKSEEARRLYRNTLDEMMKRAKCTSLVSDCSQAVLYKVDPDNGLIHSEPLFDQHRLFVSVVTGPAKGLPMQKDDFN